MKRCLPGERPLVPRCLWCWAPAVLVEDPAEPSRCCDRPACLERETAYRAELKAAAHERDLSQGAVFVPTLEKIANGERVRVVLNLEFCDAQTNHTRIEFESEVIADGRLL